MNLRRWIPSTMMLGRGLDARAMVPLIVLRFGLAGCERQPHYPTRDVIDAGFGALTITVGSDDCPTVSFTVAPAEARIGEWVNVSARATDTSDADVLTYAWTASSGLFADPASADTTYQCPGRDHAGLQTVTLSVSDGNCVVTRRATVPCLALADGGGPATTGAGGAGDAGTHCVNAADPTTCEGAPCNQCTNDNCDTVASAAANGGVPTAGCDLFVTDDQVARCQRLYACMRDHGCVQNSDPTRCWCGAVDPYACETGMEPGTGPCVQQFIDAAGSSDATVINDRLTDSNYPLGGAINLAACRSAYCSRLSDPPNPVCTF